MYCPYRRDYVDTYVDVYLHIYIYIYIGMYMYMRYDRLALHWLFLPVACAQSLRFAVAALLFLLLVAAAQSLRFAVAGPRFLHLLLLLRNYFDLQWLLIFSS